MKKITIFLLLIFCVALTAQKSFAQETEKEKFVRAAKFLEENPLDKNAKDVRTWAFVWAAETKDVTVIICGGTADSFLDKKLKFGSEMLHQYTIAMTAYKLQNPTSTRTKCRSTCRCRKRTESLRKIGSGQTERKSKND